MNKRKAKCTCVVDCNGLHEIATTTSNNLKSLYLGRLKSGEIGVPICVLNELKEIDPSAAASIEPHVSRKIKMKKQYYNGAARAAERLNSGFSRGAYDKGTDLYAAAIASIEDVQLITSLAQVGFYQGAECEVIDLVSWAEGQQ